MLIERVKELIADHYVLPGLVPDIHAALDATPTEPGDPEPTAVVLTEALQAACGDRHLRVRHHPDGVPPARDEAAAVAHWRDRARRTAGGVASVRRLDEGTGLLTLGPVLPPVQQAAPYLTPAFALLEGVDGLVIDLRDCVGGTPDTAALVVSHLVRPWPVHLLDMVDRSGARAPSRTTEVDHPLPSDAPVRVLTSERTFSGGEEVAYHLQAFARATLIGETTGGGAHPRVGFDLSDVLQLHVPVARPVHARTGTNWEGVGVVPDLACRAEDALDAALREWPVSPRRPAGPPVDWQRDDASA